jgi:hypothetical protein
VSLVAELLTEHRVARPGPLEGAADQLLGRAVRLGDRRHVRLGVDAQVDRLEPLHRGGVGHVGEDVGEAQIIVVVRHAANSSGRSGARPPEWSGGGTRPGAPGVLTASDGASTLSPRPSFERLYASCRRR